jgi:thimet oligopeptidase
MLLLYVRALSKVVISGFVLCSLLLVNVRGVYALQPLSSLSSVVDFFTVTPETIARRSEAALLQAQAMVDRIVSLPLDQRTYQNTMRAFDELESYCELSVMRNLVELLEMVHPDEGIRSAARTASLRLGNFCIDVLGANYDLYRALKDYSQAVSDHECLTVEERYYMEDIIAAYERRGMRNTPEERLKIADLERNIHQLSITFESNIARDNGVLLLSAEELAGLPSHFIAALERDRSGLYTVPLDGPSYSALIESCSVESTRKAMFHGFLNRGGVENGVLLRQLIAARDELARLLGYESYAQLVLDDTMAHDPRVALNFLHTILGPVHRKVDQEYALFKEALPDSVVLLDGQIKHWDVAFVRNSFKKSRFFIDEDLVAHYFPMDQVIERIFKIYQDFFGVSFREAFGERLWHEDVRLFEVFRDDISLGYFILDLHPRPNKYSHACSFAVVPGFIDGKGDRSPAVSLIIANFPRAVDGKPALWSRTFAVSTFFHELGHALHDLLSATTIVSFAGTHVKADFVEMPSQMLEEWLNESDILRRISCHYQTGKPLPDHLIKGIQALQSFDTGFDTQRQIMLALFALDCFQPGAHKDPAFLLERHYKNVLRHVAFDKDFHIHYSFSHLTGYGPRYYGYLWSRVYSFDLFARIKELGLLDRSVGDHFVETLLSKGGSRPPHELLVRFLGRAPQNDAFYAALGLVG